VHVPGKAVVSMPVGGGPAMMNNYMIAQPPGFQLAAFVSAALLLLAYMMDAVPSIRPPLNSDDVLKEKNCSVLYCIPQLCRPTAKFHIGRPCEARNGNIDHVEIL